MRIFASRVVNSNGIEDLEFLSEEPTESFLNDLWQGIEDGDIEFFSIREGNLNGGDSVILHQSAG